MEVERRAVWASRRDRCRQRSGVVDDQEVARFEKLREVPKPAMHQPRVVAVRDHQPDFVTGQAPGFRWLVRFELERDLELQRPEAPREDTIPHALPPPARATGPTGARSLARYRPLGRSPSTRCSSPGTLASGGGRSETSSPGNASCCICVFMSPGSTQYTRRAGCSPASTLVSCSSAAFEEP